MTKYHVNNAGQVEVCTASERPCKFGKQFDEKELVTLIIDTPNLNFNVAKVAARQAKRQGLTTGLTKPAVKRTRKSFIPMNSIKVGDKVVLRFASSDDWTETVVFVKDNGNERTFNNTRIYPDGSSTSSYKRINYNGKRWLSEGFTVSVKEKLGEVDPLRPETWNL